MYISQLDISGYKGVKGPTKIEFQEGLNVIVGENASGKTAIVDAIRLLLREDEFGHTPINNTDFHRPFEKPNDVAKSMNLSMRFAELSSSEQVAFLPWREGTDAASLSLHVDNKANHRDRYKRVIWGGAAQASLFEWELLDRINCVYLPPLRDAEARLSEGQYSRLSRLLKNLNKKEIDKAKEAGAKLDIERQVSEFNESLADEKSNPESPIVKANIAIRKRLEEALGRTFAQDTQIQFSEPDFNKIVGSLRLLFFPELGTGGKDKVFRGLDENSLGYNNLLYLATVLAELTEQDGDENFMRVLVIEEPEAHLHPQLQIRLLKHLEERAKQGNVQVIVTSHSPVLASSVPLDKIIHMTAHNGSVQVTSISKCGLNAKALAYLNRWVDATKSNLLFSKGVILVEGIAEALLLPEIAKVVLKDHPSLPPSLEDAGVSVVNMNGIYFKYFMQLFGGFRKDDRAAIPVRCAGITDNDPPKKDKPINSVEGSNPAIKLIGVVNRSEFCRLWVSPLKTLEYDLAFQDGNINALSSLLASKWPFKGQGKKKLQEYAAVDVSTIAKTEKAKASYLILKKVEASHVGKGAFAQTLADQIKSLEIELAIPEYIRNAIVWSCGGNPDDEK